MVNVPYCKKDRVAYYFYADSSTGLSWWSPHDVPFAVCSKLLLLEPPECVFSVPGQEPYRDPDLMSKGIDNPVDHLNCFGTMSFDGNPLVESGAPWYSSYPINMVSSVCPQNSGFTDTVSLTTDTFGNLVFSYCYHVEPYHRDAIYQETIDIEKSVVQGNPAILNAFILQIDSITGETVYSCQFDPGEGFRAVNFRKVDVPGTRTPYESAQRVVRDLVQQGWETLGKCQDPISEFTTFNKAMSSINALDMDNVENLSQLRDITKMFPQLRGFKNSAQAAASLYLWYRYVFQTTASDVSDIVNNLDYIADVVTGTYLRKYSVRNSVSASTSVEGQSIAVVHTTTVQFSPKMDSASLRSWHTNHALGLDLSLEHIWDLIPFSFVADWFFQVDDVLGGIDNAANVTKYDLDHRCDGVKYTLTTITAYGTITTTKYSRRIHTTPPRYQLVLGSPTIDHHWWDAAALFVANK